MKAKFFKRVLALLIVCMVISTQTLNVQAAREIISADQTEELPNERTYTKAELRLMSAIIFCEAGSECYAGKKAVGIVIMNRVASDEFPDTVKEVIYEKGQFTPARSGALAKALKDYDNGKFTTKNHKECIKAAKATLKGQTNVKYKGKKIKMGSYLFFSVYLKGAKLRIGNHSFK